MSLIAKHNKHPPLPILVQRGNCEGSLREECGYCGVCAAQRYALCASVSLDTVAVRNHT